LSGKDVFVEKPIALKIEETKDLIKIAKHNKRILMGGPFAGVSPPV
jgi:predicted dehydrogenase